MTPFVKAVGDMGELLLGMCRGNGFHQCLQARGGRLEDTVDGGSFTYHADSPEVHEKRVVMELAAEPSTCLRSRPKPSK